MGEGGRGFRSWPEAERPRAHTHTPRRTRRRRHHTLSLRCANVCSLLVSAEPRGCPRTRELITQALFGRAGARLYSGFFCRPTKRSLSFITPPNIPRSRLSIDVGGRLGGGPHALLARRVSRIAFDTGASREQPRRESVDGDLLINAIRQQKSGSPGFGARAK
eukprot:7376007-Prymnesium_polylepis.1